MARFVVPLDMLKAFEKPVLELPADTVDELLRQVRRQVGEEGWKKFSRAFVLVNGVAVSRLQGGRTPLAPQDEVWLVFPAGGG